MGKPKPTKPLAEKLLAIRLWKNMTQSDILKVVYPEANPDHRTFVSQWEYASREPSRQVLCRYAKLAGVTLDALMLDENPLPAHITRYAKQYEEDDKQKSEPEKMNSSYTPVEKRAMLTDSNQITQETSVRKFIQCSEEFSRLPLTIDDKLVESITLELSVNTLDDLHDLHLDMLRILPRCLRSSLSVEGLVNFCINVILTDYEKRNNESLISKRIALLSSCD